MKSALSCLSLLACLSVAPLALATSPGEAAAASKTESGAIVGVITLPATDEPIEGARVVLRCDCLEAPLEGSTDARGIYRFEALAAGTYTIEVFHGAANINKVFELPRGAKFRANFSIDPEDGEPRTIVISTTPVASEDAIKSLPVGAETSRDWTAIVDISPSAARDAAGVGATGKVDYWREADPGPRSGTLTAGTIDDSHDASELRDFAILSFGPRDFARKLGMAARTEVVIVDALGRPVADAIVQARVNDQGHSIQLRTGTDGRAVVSGFDLGLDPTEPSPAITFFASKAGTSRTTTARLGEDPVELRLRLHRSSKTTTVQGLDLALILDTTGSMGDEIGWLQAELRSVIDTVLADHPGIDVRLALVNYRDAGDAYVVDPLAFTSERQVFRTELADTRATGGGDYPEAVAQALATAASFDWRHDQGVAKVALLVADARPTTTSSPHPPSPHASCARPGSRSIRSPAAARATSPSSCFAASPPTRAPSTCS